MISTRKLYWSLAVGLFGLFFLGVCWQPSHAQNLAQGNQPTGDSVVVRVYFADQADVNRLAATLDVWEVHRNSDPAQRYAVILVTPAELARLQAQGYRIETDAAKTALLTQQPVAAAAQQSGIPGYPCYRTVTETYASLAKLASDHPNIAAWIDIGDSWNKLHPGHGNPHDLYALVLTNKAKAGPKPKFILMAAIHAREYTTAELATRFAEELAAKYNVDPDVTWLLDYFEVHIIPDANPDGRQIAETGVLWRKNNDNDDSCNFSTAWGTDLNRNSSFKWGAFDPQTDACNITYLGPSAASEPETQAIEAYARSIFPDQRGPNDTDAAPATTEGVFITLHSYAEEVLFPWGWTATPAPNSTQLQTLGRKFGYFNGYEVCNGQSCLYGTSGTTDDFTYGEFGVASYTFEMGQSFFESCSAFTTKVLPQNMPALYYAAKAARRPYQNPAGPDSLQVVVSATDVISGKPLTLRAVADDTRYNSNGWGNEPTQAIAAARYSVDAPAWITGTQTYSMTATDGTFNTNTENVKANVDTKGWTLGRHTLFVESRDAVGNWGVPGAVFVNVTDSPYDVTLSQPALPSSGKAGSTIAYHLTVTNTGLLTDTFAVTVSGSTWPVTAPAHLGPLAPAASAPLTVTVGIPLTAPLGASDSFTLTVASETKPTSRSTQRLTTQVSVYRSFFPIVGR